MRAGELRPDFKTANRLRRPVLSASRRLAWGCELASQPASPPSIRRAAVVIALPDDDGQDRKIWNLALTCEHVCDWRPRQSSLNGAQSRRPLALPPYFPEPATCPRCARTGRV